MRILPVFKSLDAVTVLGPGQEVQFDTPKMHVSMQVIVTGLPTWATVRLQGSIDGQNFVTIGGTGVSAPETTSIVANVLGPVVAVRANLEAWAGGTDPTVTAIIAAA